MLFNCVTYASSSELILLLLSAAGDRGLEVRGHGGGPALPVDLRDRVCVGDTGPLPPAPLPALHRSGSECSHRFRSHKLACDICVRYDVCV